MHADNSMYAWVYNEFGMSVHVYKSCNAVNACIDDIATNSIRTLQYIYSQVYFVWHSFLIQCHEH